MAVSSSNGHITIWDLASKRLFHILQSVHSNITLCHFLNGQPLLLTTGDNSVKQFVFDLNALPRFLKGRAGHSAPPTKIQFHGEHNILSASRDRSLRLFSTIRDAQTVELSQGSVEKKSKAYGVQASDLKLGVITGLAASTSSFYYFDWSDLLDTIKTRQWDDVITCHASSTMAQTWTTQNKKIGKHTFKTSSPITAVGVSGCGNFGFVGCFDGSISMYNLQSGAHRKTFSGHTKSVTGICTDDVSQTVISSSLDGTVRLWNVKTGKEMSEIQLNSPITTLSGFSESHLCAVASDDLCIRVIDIDTKRIVREFFGHNNRITDVVCLLF